MKVVIVVPAYNEASKIGAVLNELGKFGQIVVVDDGSIDETAKIAAGFNVILIRHVFNRGLGAALGTGFEMAKRLDADVTINFDADGQNNSADILRLIEPIQNGQADVVIGARYGDRKKMPAIRRVYNWIGNLVTFILFGIWVKDSQSGLRAFSKKAISEMNLNSNGWEVSSEIILEIKNHNWRLSEIDIMPIYTEYSMSKGQSFWGGVKTAWNMLIHVLTK